MPTQPESQLYIDHWKCYLITAGWGWWLTHTKPRSLDKQPHWRRPWSDGWETWCPLRRRRRGSPQRGLGTPLYVMSRVRWSRSGLCCVGLNSWSQSRRGSKTCGCSQCGSCLRSPSSWCPCRWLRWQPPPRSSQPPSSKLLQREAPYTRPGAGSQTWLSCHGRTGGLSWGQLSCSLETSRAACRLCWGPEWAGRHLGR